MQTQKGSKDITPPIITSAPDGGRWSARSLDRFTHKNEPWFSIYRRWTGLEGCSERAWRTEKFLCCNGDWTL